MQPRKRLTFAVHIDNANSFDGLNGQIYDCPIRYIQKKTGLDLGCPLVPTVNP